MSDIEYGSAEYLLGLVKLAEKRDKHFNPDNYKWVLGAYHYHRLKNDYEAKFGVESSDDEIPLIFNIPVEIDTCRITKIELWQNITNEL
jgi:hypothetical protein